MTDPTPVTTPIHKPPTKADYKRYRNIVADIHTDFAIAEQALFRLSKNLKTIQDKRLYFCGGFHTFQDFCTRELGQSRQHVYRLIAAHDVMQNLLIQGVAMEDLPISERINREVGFLPPEYQAKAWKQVLRISKEANRPPTIIDVQTEAVKLEKPKETLQRQQTELLRKYESVSVVLKTAVAFDLLEPSFRLRLRAVLIEIVERAQILMRSLQSAVVEKRTEEK
jgi:hypothetical protein